MAFHRVDFIPPCKLPKFYYRSSKVKSNYSQQFLAVFASTKTGFSRLLKFDTNRFRASFAPLSRFQWFCFQQRLMRYSTTSALRLLSFPAVTAVFTTLPIVMIVRCIRLLFFKLECTLHSARVVYVCWVHDTNSIHANGLLETFGTKRQGWKSHE